MTHIIYLLMFAMLCWGCRSTSYKFVKKEQSFHCFKKKDAKEIHAKLPDGIPKNRVFFRFEPIVTSSSDNCIGLYHYVNWSIGVPSENIPVLCFEDSISVYSRGDGDLNLKILKRFSKRYSSLFSNNELELIQAEFLQGSTSGWHTTE